MKQTRSSTKPEDGASQKIDERIAELGDWRGKTLARMRKLIHEADPEVVETWKWMGTPVFSLIRAAVDLNTSGTKAKAIRGK